MSKSKAKQQNTYKFSVRLDCDLDADLIEWLDVQPHGKRSEAIRDLMREGLRAQQLGASLAAMVRQAVAEALSGLQVVAARPEEEISPDADDVEETYGRQLDQLLDGFGGTNA